MHWWLCCLIRAGFASNLFNFYILTWQKKSHFVLTLKKDRKDVCSILTALIQGPNLIIKN
jgi:hypothetical protein